MKLKIRNYKERQEKKNISKINTFHGQDDIDEKTDPYFPPIKSSLCPLQDDNINWNLPGKVLSSDVCGWEEIQWKKIENIDIFFDENCFDEFLEQYKKVITPFCTKEFLSKWYRNGIGKPGDYYYLNEAATVYFTMKSESRALVFIEPPEEIITKCYKFELKNENGKYLNL